MTVPRRFVFFLLHAGYVRYYGTTFLRLAERGHSVRLAFGELEKDPGDRRLAEELAARHPAITFGLAPARPRSDGWRALATLARSLMDLARYIHPRYAHAHALRARVARKLVTHVESSRRVDPVTARATVSLARWMQTHTSARTSERLIRVFARLERAIPTSPAIDAFVRDAGADAVVVTPVIDFGSNQVEYLKSARRLGVPSAVAVASWDNLTGKGLIRVVPDRVFVWNETQRREAVEMHGIPADRVVATGAQKFDEWFERRPQSTAAELAARAGLDPSRPFVLYVCSSPFIAPDEVRFVRRWLESLRSSGRRALGSVGVLVRPHPQNSAQWSGVDLSGHGNVAIWPRAGAQPDAGEARAAFFDSLYHSSAVVGINTSALIEAGIVGKSVLTVLAPEFSGTQEGTLHFHYLLHEQGGFLHVAADLDAHAAQLDEILLHGDAHAEQTRRFVADFVRPRGVDRPATAFLVEGLEELAALDARAAQATAADRALRLLLAPVALGARAVGGVASVVRPTARAVHEGP